VESIWFYHLKDDETPGMKSLCGRDVMQTQIPLEHWDKTPEGYHIPEKWCKTCPALAALGKR
jgi:hypothetical protein